MAKTKIASGIPVYPMPVIILGAHVKGKPNFLTIVWLSMVNFRPPVIAAVLNKSHYTNAGLHENRVFTINIPSTELMEATDFCSVVSGYDHDKSKVFDVFYGTLHNAPMIQECPLTAECRVVKIAEFATHEIFYGEIVAMYVEEGIMTGGNPDIAKIRPILYSMYDNYYWEIGKKIGTAMHVGKRFTSKQ